MSRSIEADALGLMGQLLDTVRPGYVAKMASPKPETSNYHALYA